MEKEKPVEGIWCPWAEVLCYGCHGPTSGAMTTDEFAAARDTKMGEVPEGLGTCRCDRCGRLVAVPSGVAVYSRVRDLLKPDFDAKLEQTGGMCAALSVRRKDRVEPLVFVAGYGDVQLNGLAGVAVGLYANDDAVYDGEPIRETEVVGDEATALAVRDFLA